MTRSTYLEKRISFYWLQGEAAAPDFVKRRWEAWARMNPGNDISISDDFALAPLFRDGSLKHVPPPLQARSDIFRLHDVTTKGGLYIDCGTPPIVPVDDWLPDWDARGSSPSTTPGDIDRWKTGSSTPTRAIRSHPHS